MLIIIGIRWITFGNLYIGIKIIIYLLFQLMVLILSQVIETILATNSNILNYHKIDFQKVFYNNLAGHISYCWICQNNFNLSIVNCFLFNIILANPFFMVWLEIFHLTQQVGFIFFKFQPLTHLVQFFFILFEYSLNQLCWNVLLDNYSSVWYNAFGPWLFPNFFAISIPNNIRNVATLIFLS